MNETTQPAPEPAQPILASSLLDVEERQRHRFASRGERITTACAEVDEPVLDGGLERGIVLGVSAEGEEGRLISLHLVASILIAGGPSSARHQAKAVVVDTTGSFPISLLAKIIRSRILRERLRSDPPGVTNDSKSTGWTEIGAERVEEEVTRCLEMVAISRVFDVEGLWEVLGEVTQGSGLNHEPTDVKSSERRAVESKSTTIREIADSQEEDLTPDEDEESAPELPAPERPDEHEDQGIEIIIVDSMADIINELLARKEKSEAHNLLATLSKAIHNLSSQSNILIVLHNSTISSKPFHPSNPDAQPPSRGQAQQPDTSLSSVFASNPLKPSLGRIFSQFPSLHIMLSSIPKTREDAEVLYGQDDNSLSLSNVGYCTILEVLKDETPNLGEGRSTRRFGEREQRWVGLVVSSDGLYLRHAFPEKEENKQKVGV